MTCIKSKIQSSSQSQGIGSGEKKQSRILPYNGYNHGKLLKDKKATLGDDNGKAQSRGDPHTHRPQNKVDKEMVRMFPVCHHWML